MNKSFLLFLAASMTVSLALLGCSSDSDGTDHYYYTGYASQIEAINAAFTDGASTVKLVGPTSFIASDDPLIIPANKALDLDGFTLTDTDSPGIIVVEGNIIGFDDNNGKVQLDAESYFLSKATFTNVGTTGQNMGVTLKNAGSISILDATTNLGYVVSFTSAPATMDDPRLVAIRAGSMGIFLTGASGLLSLGEPLNIGVGHLYVSGDLTLKAAGSISGAGTLTVSKAVDTSAITTGDIVGGVLNAKSLKSGGGKFGGTVTLTGGNAISNAFAGSFAKLTSDEEASITGNVYFTLPSEIKKAVTVNNDVNLWGEGGLTVQGATVSKKLTIVGGTLTTTGAVTLGSGNTGLIVLDASGGFVLGNESATLTGGTAYTLSGAGSVSNGLTNAGSLITLGGTGITSSGGIAGGTPTLVFAGQTYLVFKDNAEIKTLNLDVLNGGSISIGAAGKELKLTNGGSITAANVQGTLSTATLFIVTNASGSLVAGTNQVNGAGTIMAGSYGTFGADDNFIHGAIPFVQSGTEAAYGIVQSNSPDSDSGDGAGSVVVFTLNSN
jgi:hypothetical protein